MSTPIYHNTGRTHARAILWGAPGSAWSGKARSYLLKKGVEFDEWFPSHRRYQQEIMPAIGYFVMPVLELPDGTLIQDSTEIMLHYEAAMPEPALIPASPLQRAVAWLVGFFGSELFSTPGLHYRWNYMDEQRNYLETVFAEIISPSRDKAQQLRDIAPVVAQFSAWPENLGVNPTTIPAVEASFEECLQILDRHFLEHPYLLGGRPSIADFGLMTFFFAHFARDPHSSNVMKQHGPRVFRWTERMNIARFTDGEFPETAPEYPADDAIPETLTPFLAYLFTNCGPEMQCQLDAYNEWAAANGDLPAGTEVNANPDELGAHPPLGKSRYTLKGVTMERLNFVDAVLHLQRVQDVLDELDASSRTRFDALVERHGGRKLLATRPVRRLKSANYRFVLE